MKRIPIHLEVDAPLSILPGQLREHKGGLLLPPNSFVRAVVDVRKIPPELRKSPLMCVASPSTLARHGIEIGRLHSEFQRAMLSGVVPHHLEVGVMNINRFPILIRKTEKVRVLDDVAGFANTYGADKMPLKMGREVLVLDPSKMPTARIGGKQVQYLDPRAKKTPFVPKDVGKGLRLKIGDFIVVLSQDEVSVPRDRFGHVFVGNDKLSHLSAKFIHSGFRGKVALEFISLDNHTIRPGDIVAMLALVKPNKVVELKQYKGKYQEQKTAKPKAIA